MFMHIMHSTHTMRTVRNLLISIALVLVPVSAIAADDYVPSRTAWDHPDLQGVWNFSTLTPFERPERYGNREFFSSDELDEYIAAQHAASQSAAEREAGIAERVMNTENARSTGATNTFWYEREDLQANLRTSIIVYPLNGRLPLVQEGVKIQHSDPSGITEIPDQRPIRYTHGGIGRNGPEDRGLSARCMVFNSGPPLQSAHYNNNIQIFQNPDYVVILAEMGFDARIVPLDGRPHVDPEITMWSGDSRGYFEGDTLVVETRNFTHLIGSYASRGIAYGDAADRLLIEKFTPLPEGRMEYRFTIDDPTTFTDRIVGVLPMTLVDDKIYEYACHAGNRAMLNVLRGARFEERQNAAASGPD